jgi:hypothetical protein
MLAPALYPDHPPEGLGCGEGQIKDRIKDQFIEDEAEVEPRGPTPLLG